MLLGLLDGKMKWKKLLMNKVVYEINSDKWTFSSVSSDQFLKMHGKKYKDSEAITVFNTKRVDFKEDELSLKYIRHELIHVHFSYCYTESIDGLKLAQQEEIFCDLVSNRFDLINKQSKVIYKLLTKRKK